MKMNILKQLEMMQSDHEPSQVSEETTIYEKAHMYLIKNMTSKSIFSSRVVCAHTFDDVSPPKIYKEVNEFFQTQFPACMQTLNELSRPD